MDCLSPVRVSYIQCYWCRVRDQERKHVPDGFQITGTRPLDGRDGRRDHREAVQQTRLEVYRVIGGVIAVVVVVVVAVVVAVVVVVVVIVKEAKVVSSGTRMALVGGIAADMSVTVHCPLL